MKKYVLGMDGGGTKTHCSIFTLDGSPVDFISWGTTNHECLNGGYDELKLELGKLFKYALDKNGIAADELGKCAFGLAGVDTKRQHGIISRIISDLGIKDFNLCNDSYLGIKAGCERGFGICAINGTAFTTGGIDSRGNMLQIGGLGAMSGGDFGGGEYLAGKAISATYNSIFKGDPDTLITELFFEILNIKSKYDFVEALKCKIDEGTYKYDFFNKLVFEAANKNDAVALEILETMGREYARCINAAIDNLDFCMEDTIDVILAGSIFVKGENSRAIDKTKQDVIEKNKDRKISFNVLKSPPVAGAVLWALEENGYKRHIREKVLSAFM
jgi:N-acetylglucosamine kinase-like BadF-type ATPase